MNKSELLSEIRRTRAEWEALLAPLSAAQMVATEAAYWSVKDTLAHIAWYEREMVGLLRQRALTGSELWQLPLEARNAAIYAANKDRSLAEIQEEARQVFAELWALLEALAEEDLHDPTCFPGMPDEWEPWQVIASNTCEHYPDHVALLF